MERATPKRRLAGTLVVGLLGLLLAVPPTVRAEEEEEDPKPRVGGWVPVEGATVEEAPEPKDESALEDELEGDALREHEKEVKRILKSLRAEKNKEIVQGRIAVLGEEGARAGRDALMDFASMRSNQEYVQHSFMALARIGGKTAIAFLCGKKALRARDFLIQQSAALALAEARDPRAFPALLDVMTGKRTKIEVVGACAIALAKSARNDEKAVKTLFEYSRHRKDTIRANVVEALGYLETDAAMERLKEALFEDKNARVRGAAALGMGHSHRKDMVPVLQQAIEEDRAFTVRNACLEAIGWIQGDARD